MQRYICGARILGFGVEELDAMARTKEEPLCPQSSSLPKARKGLRDLAAHCKFLKKAKGSSHSEEGGKRGFSYAAEVAGLGREISGSCGDGYNW